MHTITLSTTSFWCHWPKRLISLHSLWIFVLISVFSSVAFGQSLQIHKIVDKTTANSNDYVTYTIQYNCVSITNPCTNVVINDHIPDLLGQQNAVTVTLTTNTGTTFFDEPNRLAVFNLGTLPAGTTGEVKMRVAVNNVPGETVIPNSATITSGGGSPTVSNTVSTTVNTVKALPFLFKAAYTANPSYVGNGQLVQGQTGVYQFNIQNQGNVAYTDFCVVDTLPSPDKLQVTEIVPGVFGNAPATVRVEYQTNTNTTWTALNGSPFSTSISTGVPVSLPAGQYVTMVRWCFDQPFAGGAYSDSHNFPLIEFQIPADTTLGAITNCIVSSASNVDPNKYCTTSHIVPPITGSVAGVTKVISNQYPAIGDTVTFTLQLFNNSSAAQALKNGVILDSFNPLNLAYVSNSWSYSSTYSAAVPTFTTATGPDGATLLKWLLTDDVPIGGSMTVTFKAIVKNGDGASSQANRVDVTGSNVQPNSCANGSSGTADYYDIDGDGNTTESVCYNTANFTIQSLAKLTSEKLIKGQLDATYSKYPAFGNTVPGGLADYRLRVSNEGSVPMKDIVVIDVLPFAGDNGVLDPQARLSQWRPNLAGPVTPPTGVTVYYSTQSNPCRPELNYNPAGCTNANWSTVPPADITQVQALKFDFGSTIINPGDSLFLSWPMRAPTTAPTNGEIAWNSFGYVGTRTDNNTQLLPAEPIKVGIKVNPLVPADYGDFVWLDTNKDGIQDAGEPGISGVKVELYKDNGDGIPDKTTDALVGFTVTDAAGNYLFSSLQPGDYFAIFYPPSGYAVSPSLVGSDKTKDSEGIITTVTSLSATEIDLTWDLGLYPSTTCDVKIANTTVSPCTYTGSASQATVNVFVTWANAPAGQNITVSVAGAPNQTINVTGGATSPTLLTFTIAADGAAHAVTAGFDATCQNTASILSPQPCAPAVCALGITNVQTGACVNTKRQVNATVSWSNNPSGENIIVTWDGVPVDTILVSGGLGSPQPASFYVTGDAATHTVAAHFVSTTACSASVSGISAPVCVLPCGVNMVVTPSLCVSATNAYVLSGTITATNVPTSGTLTITSGAFSPRTIALPAGNASGTFSYSGLVSNGQAYTVTASYSNSVCSPVSQTYTAPASCSVAPPCGLTATATPGLCVSATNTYSSTAVVQIANTGVGGTLTITDGTASQTLTVGANLTSFTATAIFSGLVSNGSAHTVTASLPGCSTTTTTYTAPASCSIAPTCSLTATVQPGPCASATNTYSATAVVTVSNPVAGTLTVTLADITQSFATTANAQNTFTAIFNGLVSDGAAHTVIASLPGCSTATTTYTAPASCSVAPVCSLSATATPGLCASATNTYSVTAVVTVQNPASGATLTISNGTTSQPFTTTAGTSNTFTMVFNGLVSDGLTHTITASLPGCSTTTTTYTAPASCSVAPVCSLTPTVTPGLCASATNTYSATAVVRLTNPPAGVLTVTDGPRSLTTTIASGLTSYTFTATFNGLVSDGSVHTVTASLPGCTAQPVTYTAPASCSIVPVCSLSAVVTAGQCASATNTYSATAMVTVTNSSSGGTLTVSNGPASITATIPAGGGVVTFPAVFNGIPSNGSVHTVTVSLPGCGTTTTTYTAPGSCTQPIGTQLTLDKLVDKSKAQVGDVLTYTLVFTNVGSTTATNMVVRDSVSTGLRYVSGSVTAPAGTTFTPGTPISTWTIGSISAGQSMSLTFQALADSSGILYNKATIPGDTATVCTSIPVKVCTGDVYTFRLTAAPGRSSYRWFRNNVEIVGQTTNTLDVTAPGTYSLAVDNITGKCPDFSCCPFIVEEDSLPTFQAIAVPGTCTGSTVQANGQIVLSGFNPANTYQYSVGNSFNEAAPLSGSAQLIPSGGVIVSNLANPAVAQAYTIRVYNGSGCYTDVTVMLLPTVCGCPAEVCVPYVIQQTKRAKRIGDPIR